MIVLGLKKKTCKHFIIDSGKVVREVRFSVQPPQIYIPVCKFIRANKSTFSFASFFRTIKTVTRDDLDDIIEIGMKNYSQVNTGPFNILKMVMEQFNIMLDTEWGKELTRSPFSVVKTWELFENCGLYSLTCVDARVEYYLVEKKYAHGL